MACIDIHLFQPCQEKQKSNLTLQPPISQPKREDGLVLCLSGGSRDQRAVLLRSTGCRSALSPSRPRPFHSANRALVTSWHSPDAALAAGFRLRFGGETLRSGCVSLRAALRPSLHFPRSPTTDRSIKLICHERKGGVPLAAQQFVCAGQVLLRACCPGFPNAVAKAIRMGNPVKPGSTHRRGPAAGEWSGVSKRINLLK